MSSKTWLIVLVLVVVVIVGLILIFSLRADEEPVEPEPVEPVVIEPEPNTLLSMKVETAPELDAESLDSAWNDAPELEVSLANGDNFVAGSTDATLKSVYTDDEIFFLVQWDDPTESLERTLWEKQGESDWSRLPAAQYYEDKFAFIWEIDDNGIQGFSTQGCAVACHPGEGVPEGGDFGKKYLPNEEEYADIWHWKVARTNSLNLSASIDAFVDDQALDSMPYDPEVREGRAGRYSDPGEPSYLDNRTEDETLPLYQWEAMPDDPRDQNFLLDDEKVDFVDEDWQPGDRLPGVYILNATGDRADIMASSYYADGTWTLVFKRDLDTGSTETPPVDVQFTEMDRVYYFGVAAFDNAQVRHATGPDALMLRFHP
ncbi:MAG: hypothetical protein IBX61_09915 [Thermoleophilia bacterium]|nr:hypothetical protein [Thermoleophilia bacterium]